MKLQELLNMLTTLMMTDNITLDQVRSNSKHNFTDLYHKTLSLNEIMDSPFVDEEPCKYYDTDDFTQFISNIPKSNSFVHLNCRGLASNWDNFNTLLLELHSDIFNFDIIGISELYTIKTPNLYRLNGYHPLVMKTRDTNDDYRRRRRIVYPRLPRLQNNT